MSNYLVTFTPAEPYFFGNEKTFSFDNKETGSYFIISEDTPSQSAILGALRFLLLPVLKANYEYSSEELKKNEDAVGKQSFNIDSKPKQSFGKITQISPLFITFDEEKYIPIPLNHNKAGVRNWENEAKKYNPLADMDRVTTADGDKYYFKDYNAKIGLPDAYLNINDLSVIEKDEIISSVERIGINRDKNNDGFFKRQYKQMKKGYSFAVYADIKDELDGQTKTVYMGQCKSLFSVTFKKEENNIIEEIKEKIGEKLSKYSMIYCFGDAVTNTDPCDNTLFTAFNVKDYRAFKAESNGEVKKGEILHRLVKAGSIFIADDPDVWIKKHRNENAEQIGFNCYIVIGGKNNESKSF